MICCCSYIFFYPLMNAVQVHSVGDLTTCLPEVRTRVTALRGGRQCTGAFPPHPSVSWICQGSGTTFVSTYSTHKHINVNKLVFKTKTLIEMRFVELLRKKTLTKLTS